jgi:hypothetical protein
MKHILTSVMMTSLALGADATPPVTELRIDNVKHVVARDGRLQLNAIIRLMVDDIVCVHLPDGQELRAKVFKREEIDGETVKVYGESITKEDIGFGFILNSKQGVGGAVLYRKTGDVYVVEFSAELNAYVFIKQAQPPKIII